MKQINESKASQIALTSEKWRDRNGDFTGDAPKRVEPNLVLSKFLCYSLLNTGKIKRWKYVYICVSLLLLSTNVSGEIKSYTRTWVKYKIGRWYNQSSRPRVLFGFGTCDMTPLNGGILEVYHVNVSTHVWLTIFKWPSKLSTFSYP